MNVLVVDDSSFQRKQIIKVLSDQNYKIIEAENGKEALEKLSSEKVDFFISDLLMPEMSGQQLLEQLKAKGVAVPAIILTSDIQDTTRKLCIDLGAKAFLNKPVNKNELLAVIKELPLAKAS